MIGIKDLDIYLADFLSDRDVINLSWINSKCYKLYDNRFFKNRFSQKYKLLSRNGNYNVPENFDKKEFCEVFKHLTHWKYAITHDKEYLLDLFMVDYIDGLDTAVKNDSIKCFQKLSSLYTKYHESLAVKQNSKKIINFLNDEEMLLFQSNYVFRAITSNCFDYIFLLPSHRINNDMVHEVFYSFSYYYKDESEKWTNEYNAALDLFISRIPKKVLAEQRSILLQKNCFHVIKLLTQYTSPFGNFYNFRN